MVSSIKLGKGGVGDQSAFGLAPELRIMRKVPRGPSQGIIMTPAWIPLRKSFPESTGDYQKRGGPKILRGEIWKPLKICQVSDLY